MSAVNIPADGAERKALIEALAISICRQGLCGGFCHAQRCRDAIRNYGAMASRFLDTIEHECAAQVEPPCVQEDHQ